MRVRASQVFFLVSAVLFIAGKFFAGIAVFFIGVGVMMIEFSLPPRRKEEKEEKIIKPLE